MDRRIIAKASLDKVASVVPSSSWIAPWKSLILTKSIVKSINEYILSLMRTSEQVYLSSNSICEVDNSGNNQDDLYISEFLNTIHVSRLPNHYIKLKMQITYYSSLQS